MDLLLLDESIVLTAPSRRTGSGTLTLRQVDHERASRHGASLLK
jgi:hypothetical protein